MPVASRFSEGLSKKRIERLRNVFLLTFLFLIVTIIFTPLIIRRGVSFLSEEVLEGVLLLVQVSIAWNIFQLYEKAVMIREREIGKLEEEYRKREKDLLETFTYLGKMNVQMSLIKNFLGKLKMPSGKNEMKGYVNEILQMMLSVSKRNWITLRMINMQNQKTFSEYWTTSSPKVVTKEIKISNKELFDLAKDRKHCSGMGYCVVSSTGSKDLNLKTFLVFKDNNIDQEILEFLTAAVNQCEIIHTLFELKNGR